MVVEAFYNHSTFHTTENKPPRQLLLEKYIIYILRI